MNIGCAFIWQRAPAAAQRCGSTAPPRKNLRDQQRELKIFYSKTKNLWHSSLMAWRIHETVIRGEIDNREKGIVRGHVWLHGRSGPLTLELKGNAHPDLAGCLLHFKNPLTPISHPDVESLDAVQCGTIGDLTASRKVRVWDVPAEEAFLMCKRGEKPPEHMANCLYLEWFSEANGRVVIESADYELDISPPDWRLTPEEEAQRARDAAAGMAGFMQKLSEAIEIQQRGQKDPEAKWDEHDYERFLKESDARTDKYMELLDKYGDSEEAEARIAKEMGWDREEENDQEPFISAEEMNQIVEDAMNEPPAPDPHTEGKNWIRTKDGEIRHPLQHRCFQSAMNYWHECDALGLEKSEDADLHQFIFEFQTASVKLAGALDGVAEGNEPRDAGFTVAYLKRALDHIHKAQAGLEAVASRKRLPDKLISGARKELFEIREDLIRLMDEFRGRE
jgi:hypothetical protein